MTVERQIPADELCELLPWYANGTLNEFESRAMDAHLRCCASCANELPVLRALQQSVQRESVAVLAPKPNAEQFLALAGRHNLRPRWQKMARFAGGVAASVTLLVAVGNWAQIDESTTAPYVYQTETSAGSDAAFDYVLLISFDRAVDSLARDAAMQALAPTSIAGPDAVGNYRVVVRLPARSMDELDDFVQRIESAPAISSAVVVAIELPLETR